MSFHFPLVRRTFWVSFLSSSLDQKLWRSTFFCWRFPRDLSVIRIFLSSSVRDDALCALNPSICLENSCIVHAPFCHCWVVCFLNVNDVKPAETVHRSPMPLQTFCPVYQFLRKWCWNLPLYLWTEFCAVLLVLLHVFWRSVIRCMIKV